jgi:hypothetical protein
MLDGDKSNIYRLETFDAKIAKGIKEKDIN